MNKRKKRAVRNYATSLRLSEQEYSLVVTASESLGMSVAEYCRVAITSHALGLSQNRSPEGDRLVITEFAEYFNAHFPKLKELAHRASKLENCSTDEEINAAIDLLGRLTAPLTAGCYQFQANV